MDTVRIPRQCSLHPFKPAPQRLNKQDVTILSRHLVAYITRMALRLGKLLTFQSLTKRDEIKTLEVENYYRAAQPPVSRHKSCAPW